MRKFEIGTIYSLRSICNHECIYTYEVIARTACTVTLKDKHGDVHRCRINKDHSEYNNAETVFPDGRYSMCPVLTAEKVA